MPTIWTVFKKGQENQFKRMPSEGFSKFNRLLGQVLILRLE